MTISPLNYQKVTLAKPIIAGDLTFQTQGKFEITSTGSGIVGRQMICFSPGLSVVEGATINQTAEPTLVEDRSASNLANIYEYTFENRGLHSDNDSVPATKYDTSREQSHSYGADVVIPLSLEYFKILLARVDEVIQKRVFQAMVVDQGTDVTLGTGLVYLSIPEYYNDYRLGRAYARVITAGTGGTNDVEIKNITTGEDMTLTAISIADGGTEATAEPDTINGIVSTGDLVSIDVSAVSTTTAARGLLVVLEFTYQV